MTERYASVAELYDKVTWEGGLWGAIFSYGIRAEDLPEDTPPDIVALWRQLEEQSGAADQIDAWLEQNADTGREYL